MKRAGDSIGVREDVVVSQYSPHPVRRLQLAQYLGTGLRDRRAFRRIPKPGHGYEVSRQGDQVGTQIVDDPNGLADGMNRKTRIVMKIAEQRDGKAFESGRPSAQSDVLMNEPRTVRLEQRRIRRERRHSGSRRQPDELSPVDRKKSQSLSNLTPQTMRRPLTLQHNLRLKVGIC